VPLDPSSTRPCTEPSLDTPGIHCFIGFIWLSCGLHQQHRCSGSFAVLTHTHAKFSRVIPEGRITLWPNQAPVGLISNLKTFLGNYFALFQWKRTSFLIDIVLKLTCHISVCKPICMAHTVSPCRCVIHIMCCVVVWYGRIKSVQFS